MLAKSPRASRFFDPSRNPALAVRSTPATLARKRAHGNISDALLGTLKQLA
jgi:hypothetical protein